MQVTLANWWAIFGIKWSDFNDLVEKGHKRIGMLSGTLDDPVNGFQKFAGYRSALEDGGASFNEDYNAYT